MLISGLIGLLIGCVVCFPLGIRYRKNVAEKEISSAEEEGKRIINDAIKSAESKKREALVEAKEEILKSRSEYEKEEKARRADLQRQETACSRRKRTSTVRPRQSKRKKKPSPRSTQLLTGKTRRLKSLSAARRKCWSVSPDLLLTRQSST